MIHRKSFVFSACMAIVKLANNSKLKSVSNINRIKLKLINESNHVNHSYTIEGSFRKHVNKYAEFVFITAPHKVIVPPTPSSNESSSKSSDSTDDDSKNSKSNDADQTVNDGNQRSWWSNKDDGTFKGTNRNGPAFGFNESLQLVEETWITQGPFHGLLGFSQGACFVGLLCNLSARGSK